MTRRTGLLLALSFVFLAVGLFAGRIRDVGALSAIEEQGPSTEVMAVLAAFDADEAQMGDALLPLLDALSDGDTPLLDRRPQYDWVDAYRIEPLRGADLAMLDGTIVAPESLLGVQDEALDAELADAPGVLSAVTVGCGFEALAAERSVDGVSIDEAVFAGQGYLRKEWARSRRMAVDLRGATSEVLLRLSAQVGPASSGAFTVSQSWELEMLVDRDDGTTARLVARWMEVANPQFGAGNRVWPGWVLHGAYEDAAAWTAACRGDGDADGQDRVVAHEDGVAWTETRVMAPSSAEWEAAREAAPPLSGVPSWRREPGADVQPAPLCDGVRLVVIEPHARTLQEIQLELDTISVNFDALDAEIDAQTADLLDGEGAGEDSAVAKNLRKEGVDDRLRAWQAEGARRWAEVVGTPLSAMTEREQTMMRRLVDRFGDAPDQFQRAVRTRIEARWRSGAMAEFLETDSVSIPVCPDDIAFAADKLGWRDAEARRKHRDDLDLVVASLLLESGSVRAANRQQWEAMREVFAFGQALHDLFSSPAPDGFGFDTNDGGSGEIDSIDVDL